jgi:hypothetical protein
VYISATDYRTANLGPGQAFANSGSHTALTDRDVANSHPQAAITGLTTADVPVFAGVNFDHATSTYSTIIVAGSASATVTYTLPASAPSTNSSSLTCQTNGTLAWETISGGFTQGCRVHSTANQTIGTGAWTAVVLDAERFDTDTMHDNVTNNTRITFTTAGKYLVGGQVKFNNSSAGSYRMVAIRRAGSDFLVVTNYHTLPAGDYVRLAVSTVYDFSAADYVELVVLQDTGGNLNILEDSGSQSSEFYAIRIL